jgi:NADPH-dependent curcumin reductase CurA
MNSAITSRHWVLVNRPQGTLKRTDLERTSRPVLLPGESEVLVRVLYLAMDPAIRGFMNATGSYAAPMAIGDPVRGMVLGQVVRSRSTTLSEGQVVWGFGTWSDYVAGPAAQFHPVSLDADFDLPAYAHVLGTIGLTACYGLIDIAVLTPGDTVLVSAAAGAVGSLVGQIAKINGASRVVGIAGGAAKCALAVERYGYDSCIDYKAVTDLSGAIGYALPNGIDVHFESVGGGILEAAIGHLSKNARVAICGLISHYNAAHAEGGPSNLWNLVVNTAQIRGFLVSDILGRNDRTVPMLEAIASWIKQGKLNYDVDVREGFETIPEVYNCLFKGTHTGRLIVKIADLRSPGGG